MTILIRICDEDSAFLNLRLFDDGEVDCVMSNELCDEFVSWTNH